MSTTPENQLNTPVTETAPAQKSGGLGFKLALALLVVLAGTGAAGYLAYERGMANPYLPELLQKKTPEVVTITPVNPASSSESAPAPSAPTAPMTSNGTTASSTPVAPTDGANTPPSTAPSTAPTATSPAPTESTTANASPSAPSASAPAPSVSSSPSAPSAPAVANKPMLSNAATSALLSTMDAQNQWQSLQYEFHQNWDTASALQQIQMLKNQLQAANNSALLPAISALTQVEGQIQAWNSLNPKGNLAALQQSMSDMGQLHIRTTEDIQKAEEQAAPNGWWNRFVATLKHIFEIKRVNTNEVQALNTATAAIVKQGINANLTTALWSARSGQWSVAQEQVRMANNTIAQYGQGYTLDALKPLMDNAGAWPSTPDFNVVQQALTQARAQLTAQMQSESASTPSSAPAPATTPSTQPNASGSTNAPAKGVSL